MKRNRDDEDDDSDDFVTIGTPLPLYDEDEIPVRKPVTLQDQSVRDAQGRIRFHGAFTGGFSAGYFNTVDTKEGWTPRTFKSSRSQKTEDSQIGQKPEDFMDDEDFSEFGIAPKKVATTKNFTDSENVRKRKAATESHRSDDSLFGSSHLMDLVMPCRSSMGVRLLRKLGWRDSQGIGPRERKRKKRPHQGKLKPSGSAENESTHESQKKYGCAPPPGLHRPPGGGESDGRSSDEDDDDNDGLDGITFAPHDVCPINFDPKANVHGLGYRGIDPTTALFHGNRMNPLPVKTKGRRLGIRGQAFGVGAFEEDDDDIYGVESMTNYDFQIGNDDHKESSTHGWTAPKHATEKRSFEEILKNKDVLDGFRCVSTSILPKTNFPPPQLPRDFRPFHVFESTSTLVNKELVVRSKDGGAKMNAFSRGDLLGERPHLRSIFELVSAEDRAKMEAARMQLDLKNTSQQQQHQPASSDEPPKVPPASTATRLDETASSSRDAEADNKVPDNKVPDEPKRFSGFVPFARDPMKQKRYESYLEAMRHNRPYVHDNGSGSHMTDWEKEREKEEFSKAAHLFQPLSNMIASRFTRAKHDDNDTNVELPADKEKSAQAKAAEMKMFGKLTRQSCEWHPDKMVCRRFNIADPYPESKIVGLRTAKREKCSIFNFLEFPSQAEEDDNQNAEAGGKKETELEQVKESDARPMKPLAILATVDLRPKVGNSRADAVLNAEKKRESLSAVAPSAETNEDAAEDEDRRPPIDLFKAIFEDTDSDESSDDESPDKTTAVAETSSVLVVPIESVEPFQEDRETEVPPQLTPSNEAKTETAELPISNDASPSLAVVTDDVVMLESADGSEAFGPALPPPLSVNKSGDQNTSDRRSNSKSSKVKGHHKSSKHKHKHKTHKSTSKKHKQKKKKRKKKTTKATSSQSSGSDADYDTDSESPSDIDLRLMSKLKGYVEKGKDKESTVKRKK